MTTSLRNLGESGGRTPLMIAANGGYMAEVEAELEAGADVDERGSQGQTALMEAAGKAHLPVLKRLLAQGANVNARRYDGLTALCLACAPGREETARLLIASGADPDLGLFENGGNPLTFSIGGHLPEIARLLLEKGANPNYLLDYNETILMRAAASNNLEGARLLLEGGADPNRAVPCASNALCRAVIGGHVAMTHLLLKGGANPNLADRDGRTPLSIVCRAGYVGPDLALTEVLLASGADVSGREGAKLLHESRARRRDDLVAALERAGAREPGATDLKAEPPSILIPVELSNGRSETRRIYLTATSLRDAVMVQDAEWLRALLTAGMDPNTRGENGTTILVEAALAGGRKAMLPLLLNGGADINAHGRNGATALWYAVCHRDLPTARMLLERGANLELAESFGKTPLLRAVWENNAPMTQLLLAFGANPTAQDHSRQNAFEVAAEGDCAQVWEILLPLLSEVDVSGEFGGKMLLMTTKHGNVRAAGELLARGVNPNTNFRGVTPLVLAAYSGNMYLIRALIERGAHVNMRGIQYHSPLNAACAAGHLDAARVLLDAGADPNIRDDRGCTPLWRALRQDHALIALLLARGADVNARNDHRQTPLMAAAEEDAAVVALLLASGADVTARDWEGQTALSNARRCGQGDSIGLLQKAGTPEAEPGYGRREF